MNKKSIFLQRIIALLAISLILSGLLTSVVYTIVIQRVYMRMQANELLSIVRTVAEVVQISYGEVGQRRINSLFSPDNRNFLGARLHIYNAAGGTDMSQPETPSDPLPNDMVSGKSTFYHFRDDDLISITQPVMEEALQGRESIRLNSLLDGERYLVGGVPIINEDGDVEGAIIFTKKFSELSQSLKGLNFALLLSTLLTFLIMLVPGYLAAKKLTVPLLQMRNVSLSMAKGDFSIRADENQKGEIGELAASINRFAEESQRLEKTRQDYVSNVSHELRTPIAAIRAMSETLSDGMILDEDKKQQYYQRILGESMRLSRLVDDLLELSRLQSGAIGLQKSEFPLSELLQNCVETYSAMASDIGINLTLEADLDALPQVYSNPDRIQQVLIILLDNAFKHTLEGGKVVLLAKDCGAHIEVAVADNGDGIPAEDLPYVFDRFYKVDKSHSSGGTGLGLSIAKELLLLLQEEIGVTCEPGEGARFRFTIHKANI